MAILKEDTPQGKTKTRSLKPYKSFETNTVTGEVYRRDALPFLRSLPDESADLLFIDPPFNLGKKYAQAVNIDRRPEADYWSWMLEVLSEGVRVIAIGGSLYLYHIPLWAMRFGAFLEQHLDLRHWIAISMKSGFARGERLYPAHYSLLYFTKGTPASFQRPKIDPTVCRNCHEMIKDYGGYKSIILEKGINLSDFWEDLSPVRHSNYKSRSSNELPVKLTDRVLEISGNAGGTFIDPFSGAGTAVLSAARAGMHFKACDILLPNCRLLCRRLQTLENGDD
jgi:site-specific DNA-methyltransferase (adenine-specific)